MGHIGPGLFVDEVEAQDLAYDRGWTDGLPIIPATEARVGALLDVVALPFDLVIGTVTERRRSVTVGKAAVNAVMAGCLPEHFPVVLAGLRAILEPQLNIHALASSTGGPAPLLIVSGPIVDEAGLNSGGSAFGPGNRANATIGRAIRLVLMNVLGAVPGILDGSTLGHPGKYSYCIAEADPPEPWQPLRVELGYEHHWSAVIAIGAEGPRQVSNAINPDARGILDTIATAIACPANNIAGHPTGVGGQCVLVLGPEHADTIREAGWSRRDVREYLHERSVLTRGALRRAGRLLPGPEDDADRLPTIDGPDSILLVTAGGYGGRWSAVVPTWTSTVTTRFSSHPVEQTIPMQDLHCDDEACRLFED